MKVTKHHLLIVFLFGFVEAIFSQNTPNTKEQQLQGVHIDRYFDWKYKFLLKDVLRVYPLALEAKKVIDNYEHDLAEIEKKRKQKKYLKASEKELKLNFEYTIKDLYVSEGKLLMKLIHRETGMTVDEILRKYKGNLSAGTTFAALKLFGHNTKIEYDPLNEDWITEVIVQDIISGKVQSDLSPRILSKQEFKDEMKVYKDDIKTTRRKKKALRKNQRIQKKGSK